MINRKNTIRLVSFNLLAFIGFLFFYKYGVRISSLLPYVYVPYAAAMAVFILFLNGIVAGKTATNTLLVISNIILLGTSFILFQYVGVKSLDVDRWSVITHYWDAYFDGQNPYSSRSHMGNYYGSYPFYFILNLPFYFIGEIGWAPVFSLFVFQAFVQYLFKDVRVTFAALILSMAFLCLPYEITTRSTIFANSVYVMICAWFLIKYWHTEKYKLLCLASFITGLLVCSRAIYGLVFLIAGLLMFRKVFTLQKFVILGAFSAIGLLLPFFHLYILFPEDILIHNPISFMTTHFVPTWFYLIYLVAAIVIGYFIRSREQFFFGSGIFLFFVIACYAVRYLYLEGWYNAIFDHHIDISYFFMPVPFLIIAICAAIKTPSDRAKVVQIPGVSV